MKLDLGTPKVANESSSSVPVSITRKPSQESADSCEDLYRTICHKSGEGRDPTGMVRPDVYGEIQALRIYEDIIRQHPHWTSDQIDNALVQAIYTLRRRNRITAAYQWVQIAMRRFINKQPGEVFNSREKRQLKARIHKTRLELPPPASIYSDEPDLFTKADVYYERTLDGQTRMRVGGAYLFIAKSWFNIIFTLAHELAHSIDPCELKSANLSFPAYDRLTACFLRNNLIATQKTRQECGENDQLSETFADWVAVQITAEALKSYASEFDGVQLISAAKNSVKDLCEQDEHLHGFNIDTDHHPAPKVRIQGIFGRNPEIRRMFNCKSRPETEEYCTFEKIKALIPGLNSTLGYPK